VSPTAVIQLGSIAAVLWYFWRDLTQITTGVTAIAQITALTTSALPWELSWERYRLSS